MSLEAIKRLRQYKYNNAPAHKRNESWVTHQSDRLTYDLFLNEAGVIPVKVWNQLGKRMQTVTIPLSVAIHVADLMKRATTGNLILSELDAAVIKEYNRIALPEGIEFPSIRTGKQDAQD